jgi:hypothetical protein
MDVEKGLAGVGETGISDLAADVNQTVRKRQTLAWEWKSERGLVRDSTELEPARRPAVAYREAN